MFLSSSGCSLMHEHFLVCAQSCSCYVTTLHWENKRWEITLINVEVNGLHHEYLLETETPSSKGIASCSMDFCLVTMILCALARCCN